MIEFKNVTFEYNKNIVINNVSFKVECNDVLAVLGHNGAGKTTIFRLIMGLIKAKTGQIILDNTKLYSEGFKYISFLPENNGIYENLSAYQNLNFRGRISSLDLKSIRANSEELIKKFGLSKRCKEQVFKWSNGMKKRLGLACALVSKPKILILDEPTNGIDPESLNILIEVINELRSNGTTVIFSTHNLYFASKIANKVIIIQNGENVFHADIETITEPIENLYLKYTKTMEE